MTDARTITSPQKTPSERYLEHHQDTDPLETAEWLQSLEYVLSSKGPDRTKYLLSVLEEKAAREGVELPIALNTPYINTISADRQPPYPGNREMERRIKSIVRWNAMAMVTRANSQHSGIGGHISTYASAATLYEVAFQHFLRGRGEGYEGDQVYYQGHAAPGIYARAYLEGRLTEEDLNNFRRELQPTGGLSSYPHPWLMPTFWEFPTVSMGLGPIMAIYQARFDHYLRDRGLKDTSGVRVWAFLGDGECDRTGDPGRHHPGSAGATGQPDFCGQLQPPEARRPRARQWQDYPGAGSALPRAGGTSSRSSGETTGIRC